MLCAPAAVPGVKSPDDVIVPTVAFPPVKPSTDQVTLELGKFVCNCNVCVKVREPRRGLMVTVAVAEEMVIMTDADLVLSAIEVACSVTVAGLGAVAGAL